MISYYVYIVSILTVCILLIICFLFLSEIYVFLFKSTIAAIGIAFLFLQIKWETMKFNHKQ